MEKRNMGEIMVACLTSFGNAAEPKEVGRRGEEIAFGNGVLPSHAFQPSAAKRALRDAGSISRQLHRSAK